jgi:5-methyltetrahydrofolate--homocysteine methyltransferase
MDVPLELPLLLDDNTAWGFSARTAKSVKNGADAVCAQLKQLAQHRAEYGKSLPAEAAGHVPVCGTLGPSGILLPPAGDSNFEDVYDICRGRVCALKKLGARFLLLERQTSLADMRASLLAARGFKIPVFCCLSAGKNAEEKFLPALITLQAMGASAVGLCGIPDESMLSVLKKAVPYASVPLAVVADAPASCTPEAFAKLIRPLLGIGIRLIACGKNTSQEHLCAAKAIMKKYGPPEIPEESDCYAAATEWETFFLGDDIRFSRPIRCSSLLGDKLINLDDEEVSAALVKIESISDARILGANSTMAKLPVAIRSDSATELEAALRYFQGRLIIDSTSPVGREVLEPLADKYGAILY